jgi:hypothetical protein
MIPVEFFAGKSPACSTIHVAALPKEVAGGIEAIGLVTGSVSG